MSTDATEPPTSDSWQAGTNPRAPGSPGSVPPASDPDQRRPKPRRRRARAGRKAPWWELPLLVIIAVTVAVVLKSFVVQPFYIPSASMEQTLHGCPGCSGDRILVNKPIYDLRDPHPGDIVVFKAPAGWDPDPIPNAPANPILKAVHWAGQLIGLVPPSENDIVKRVIAIGGQTVRCCDSQGRVEVSDSGPSGPFHSLDEPYIYENLPWVTTDRPGQPLAPGDDRTFGPVTIPKGRLWVMGDHRSDSDDSRYHLMNDHFSIDASTVAGSAVIGKAVLIVWPPSRWRTLGTPSTFKQLAVGIGGTGTPVAAGIALVFPLWRNRRRRRTRSQP
jgi:signal peptidase I